MLLIGAAAFGIVTGYVTYRTLRRVKTSGLSDIATVIGIVGGAAITALFPATSEAFGAYGVGLAAGFFIYLALSLFVAQRTNTMTTVNEWLGEGPGVSGSASPAIPPPGQAPDAQVPAFPR